MSINQNIEDNLSELKINESNDVSQPKDDGNEIQGEEKIDKIDNNIKTEIIIDNKTIMAKHEINDENVDVKEEISADAPLTVVEKPHKEEILKIDEFINLSNIENEFKEENQKEDTNYDEDNKDRSFDSVNGTKIKTDFEINLNDNEVKFVEESHQELTERHGDITHELEESFKHTHEDESSHVELEISENINIDATDATDVDTKLSLEKDIPLDVNDPDNFVDILGNNQLTKRVLKKGLGRESRPTHGDLVRINYKAWNSRGIKFAEEMESLVVGDGDMIQAFDLALCLAEKHEEFELITDARFAYGVQGLYPDIQPNETLKYHITLLEVEDSPDYSAYSYNDRVFAADRKRERGNYLYRREEFSYAVNSYSRAIKIIETDPDFKKSFNDPSKAELFEVFVKVTNNLAASQLKLDNFDSVIETCDNILSYDPTNVKALFRKGKGLTMKGSYDEAILVLKKAFEIDNKNKLIVNEIQKCTKLKRAEEESKLKLYRKMFGNDNDAASVDAPSSVAGWKTTLYKYSPYVGAALATAFSIFLATVAITKSKGT